MKRNLGFDVARSISMLYIVGVLHLSGYTGLSIAENKACVSLIWSTLGVFTFLSAYLLASRNNFSSTAEVAKFYKKRLLRFYPLFFISSLALVAIGFNSWSETWKGLIGISPFWKPQQQTLWYISTLIFLYLITPILAINSLKKKILNATLILLASLLIEFLWHSVDFRFYYYFLIYVAGIITAKHFPNASMNVLSSKWSFMMLVPYVLILLAILYFNKHILMLGGGYLGVFVILNLSLFLSQKIINQVKVVNVISFISYGSMCVYLFHREIYWLFLKLWTPQNPVSIWLYLLLIAFPITILLGYYIQKGYDSIFK